MLFANPLGAFPTMGETPAAVNSGITVLGKGMPAATEFFFTAGAAPYFTNVVPSDPANPTQLNVPCLSEDLRVHRDAGRIGRRADPRARRAAVRREHVRRRLRHVRRL